jgi:hypothetical protein
MPNLKLACGTDEFDFVDLQAVELTTRNGGLAHTDGADFVGLISSML